MKLKFFCLIILGVFACNEVNQWKQPTKVCFKIDLASANALGGKIVFESGQIAIGNFSFLGKREEGADIYFTKEHERILYAQLNNKETEALEFDIPQGVYKMMQVELGGSKNNLPNLLLDAVYISKSGDKIPLRFEFEEPSMFAIEGETSLSSNRVLFADNTKNTATILLNTTKWFESIELDKLEKAERVFVQKQNTILINKQTNVNIYNNIVIGLNKGTQKAIFVNK